MSEETTTPQQPSNRGGAPLGNTNRRKHGARGRVMLGRPPKGYGHVYRKVHELLRALRSEWETKFGEMSVSQQEALAAACQWAVRARCWHRWARGDGRTDAERNQALSSAVECNDRYVNRLKALGLCKAAGSSNANDPFAGLDDETPYQRGESAIDAPDATDESTIAGKRIHLNGESNE